jgi:serine/threonine protein phosphatase PrpC
VTGAGERRMVAVMERDVWVHGVSDPGRQHTKNEDSWQEVTLAGGRRLLVLCDGMGGMGRGAEASRLAVDTLVEFARASTLPPRTLLEAAIDTADRKVRTTLCNGDDLPGSTVVAVLVDGARAIVAWVGDSRAYWVRGAQILDRTKDHKLVQGLLDAGHLDAAGARKANLSQVLSRSLGGRPPEDAPVDVAVLPTAWELAIGDRVLLCSDGVADLVPDAEIPGVLDGVGPDQSAQDLVDLANRRGGHDNATAVVLAFGVEPTPSAKRDLLGRMDAEAPTEGFAPTREIWPTEGTNYDEVDEADRATVLARSSHEQLAAALMPTPAPASGRATEPEAAKPLLSYSKPSTPTPAPSAPATPARSGPPVAALAVVGVVVVALVLAGAWWLL